MRLLLDRRRQCADDRGGEGQAAPRRRNRARGLGLTARKPLRCASWGNRISATFLLSGWINQLAWEAFYGCFIGLDVSLAKTAVRGDRAIFPRKRRAVAELASPSRIQHGSKGADLWHVSRSQRGFVRPRATVRSSEAVGALWGRNPCSAGGSSRWPPRRRHQQQRSRRPP